MLTDIEIASNARLKKISEVAHELGISEEDCLPYGHYKAKIDHTLLGRLVGRPDGKLVLVTAINPTPAGEGKTTTTVGIGQAMKKIGRKAIIALREPSLGPVFGMKGGAAGGGYAQVLPMEDINLHFTGDMHAITSANNLLCALLDNHLQQGNQLGIDPRRIIIKRCLDMNDRTLRQTVIALGGKINGVPREDGFIITVASEIMAVLCLCGDLADLKARLGRIVAGYTYDGKPITAADLKAQGAMAALLKEAVNPNLVQTLEGTPALIHGGPFANIAHGCNSLIATRLGLKLADYCVTEAGFGSDLGAEKFMDIKCRFGGISPSAIVIVATARALKYNGGAAKTALAQENLGALEKGVANLGAHIENMRGFGVPVVVALNRFASDTDAEIRLIKDFCVANKADFSLCEVFAKGGEGGIALAKSIVDACERPNNFKPLYPSDMPLEEKIRLIARKVYGADGVIFTHAAEKDIALAKELGADHMPVCMAKTQYSLSDDPSLLGRPSGFSITVRGVKVSAGAGFAVALSGDIMTMPGLPKIPAAQSIDIDAQGNIKGLF